MFPYQTDRKENKIEVIDSNNFFYVIEHHRSYNLRVRRTNLEAKRFSYSVTANLGRIKVIVKNVLGPFSIDKSYSMCI